MRLEESGLFIFFHIIDFIIYEVYKNYSIIRV